MLDNILRLENKFDVFMFDLFGVIWNGTQIINNAEQTMQSLKEKGKQVIILSNAPILAEEIEKKYAERGLIKGKHYDSITTSGDLAYDYFSNDNKDLKYFIFGKPNPAIFAKSKYKEVTTPEDADFIYCGIPSRKEGDKWSFEKDIKPFEEELKKFKKLNKIMICINPDLKAHLSENEMMICEGAAAIYYQEIGGDVEFIGKPYPEVFDFALRDCGEVDDDRILMIGDTLETDILGANSYGIKSALVPNGVSYINMLEEEIDDIKEYSRSLDIKPDYFL